MVSDGTASRDRWRSRTWRHLMPQDVSQAAHVRQCPGGLAMSTACLMVWQARLLAQLVRKWVRNGGVPGRHHCCTCSSRSRVRWQRLAEVVILMSRGKEKNILISKYLRQIFNELLYFIGNLSIDRINPPSLPCGVHWCAVARRWRKDVLRWNSG